MSMDIIYRQDAIDAIIAEGRNVESRYLESERIIHESDAVEAIAMLPSAQPERKWIPCSERLPEENGRYLVTNGNWGANQIDINIWMSELGGWVSNDKPIAWMPLPEPYEEE